MTKERRLAIEMWKRIADLFPLSYDQVEQYKKYFCRTHDLNWQNECWFCNYIHNCAKCPLHACNRRDSAYHIAFSQKKSFTERSNAINTIILALGGKIDD